MLGLGLGLPTQKTGGNQPGSPPPATRITEEGEIRVTEEGDVRVIEED